MTQAQLATLRQNRTLDAVPDAGIGSVGWIAHGWGPDGRANPMTRVRIVKMHGTENRICRAWCEATGREIPCPIYAIWEHPRD